MKRHLFALTLALAGASFAQAQEYPSRPIQIVVVAAAGGTTDALARLFGAQLQQLSGQPVVVENVAGASGNIGMERVARATPDGYTVALISTIQTGITAARPPKGYDLLRDFEPVIKLTDNVATIVTGPKTGYRSIADVLAKAKAHPGSVTYSTPGSGSGQHIATEIFASMAGVELTHVPYKGEGAALPDLIAGRIDFAFLGSAKQFTEKGVLVPLGVTSKGKWPLSPDLPVIGDTVPGFSYYAWTGIVVPAKTPPAVIAKLNSLMNTVLASKQTAAALDSIGLAKAGGSPNALAQQMRDNIGDYRQIIVQRKLKFED